MPKILKDNGNHFLAEGPRGTFKIAKSGLHKATQLRFERAAKMAEGGEVDDASEAPAAASAPKPAEPAKPVEIHAPAAPGSMQDRGTHFHVTSPHGHSFKIAKHGLGPHVIKAYTKMCEGGDVVAMADGGVAPDPYAPAPDQTVETPDYAFDNSRAPGVAGVPGQNLQPSGPAGAPVAPPADPAMLGWDAGMMGGMDGPLAAPPAFAGLDQGKGFLPPVKTAGTGVYNPADTSAQQPPQAPQQAMPEVPMAQVYRQKAVSDSPEYQAAQAQADQAQLDRAAAAKRYADGVQAAQDAKVAGLDAARVASQNKYQQLTQQGDQLRQDIMSSKIDPNKYWDESGAGPIGSRIIAGLGILFSGYGQGRAGAGGLNIGNSALQVIQQGIDRSIDAQKANLGKKQSMLSDIYHQTNDLRLAEAETRLHLGTVAQAQAEKLAASLGSDQAQATAQQFIAAGRAKNEQLRVDVANMNGTNAANAATVNAANKYKAQLMGMAPAGGAGGVDKPIMDRVTALTMTAGALDKILGEADSRKGGETPGALAGVGETASRFVPGIPAYRGGSDWNLTTKLATGELGKLAKGGVGSEHEVQSLLDDAPGQNDSVERKQLWIDKLHKYTRGLKENMNEVFMRQGHASYAPYPEVLPKTDAQGRPLPPMPTGKQ